MVAAGTKELADNCELVEVSGAVGVTVGVVDGLIVNVVVVVVGVDVMDSVTVCVTIDVPVGVEVMDDMAVCVVVDGVTAGVMDVVTVRAAVGMNIGAIDDVAVGVRDAVTVSVAVALEMVVVGDAETFAIVRVFLACGLEVLEANIVDVAVVC